MKDTNNKLVPLPNPDERQRVPKEHSLNLLAHPYIRRRPAKVLYAVVMAALVLGAVGMAIFYPFSQRIIGNEIEVAGVSVIQDYLAIYLGAFYFRLRG